MAKKDNWIDISNLPKTSDGFGSNKGRIVNDYRNWSGMTAPFLYKNIKGIIEFGEYNSKKQKIVVKYKGKECKMATSQLMNCNIGSIVGAFLGSNYKWKVGDVINNTMTVLELTRRNSDKKEKSYILKCNICNGEFEKSEGHLLDKNRNIESCPFCGKRRSMGEKLIYYILRESNCSEVVPEFNNKDTKNKRYDFMFVKDNVKYIIEVHGIQHYKQIRKIRSRTLEEEQENDKFKRELAISDLGILSDNYIVLDYSKSSNINIFKSEILKSRLNDVLDLSKINWDKAEIFATMPNFQSICTEYNNGLTIPEIQSMLGIGKSTVSKALIKGNKLGIVDYSYEERNKQQLTELNKKKMKEIICMETGIVYESATYIAKVSLKEFGIKMIQSKVSKSCNNKSKYKGYTFRYTKEKDEYKNNDIYNNIVDKWNDGLDWNEISMQINRSANTVREYLIKAERNGDIKGYFEMSKNTSVQSIIKKNEKKIICEDNGIIYESATYIEKESINIFGIKLVRNSIARACRRGKKYYGITFKYLNEGCDSVCQPVC